MCRKRFVMYILPAAVLGNTGLSAAMQLIKNATGTNMSGYDGIYLAAPSGKFTIITDWAQVNLKGILTMIYGMQKISKCLLMCQKQKEDGIAKHRPINQDTGKTGNFLNTN